MADRTSGSRPKFPMADRADHSAIIDCIHARLREGDPRYQSIMLRRSARSASGVAVLKHRTLPLQRHGGHILGPTTELTGFSECGY